MVLWPFVAPQFRKIPLLIPFPLPEPHAVETKPFGNGTRSRGNLELREDTPRDLMHRVAHPRQIWEFACRDETTEDMQDAKVCGGELKLTFWDRDATKQISGRKAIFIQ